MCVFVFVVFFFLLPLKTNLVDQEHDLCEDVRAFAWVQRGLVENARLAGGEKKLRKMISFNIN